MVSQSKELEITLLVAPTNGELCTEASRSSRGAGRVEMLIHKGWDGCAVLGLSFVVEGYSLLVATRAVVAGAAAAGLGTMEFIKRGMDPTSIAVMLEDGAAVAGLVIAGAASFAANPSTLRHSLVFLPRKAVGSAYLWREFPAREVGGLYTQWPLGSPAVLASCHEDAHAVVALSPPSTFAV